MNYDTHLFIEIIESIQGIVYLREEVEEDIRLRLYSGLNGKLVKIDVSDEDMYDNTAKGHLDLLGLIHLIPAMFPEQPEPDADGSVIPEGEPRS
jgi:hypothetical protein